MDKSKNYIWSKLDKACRHITDLISKCLLMVAKFYQIDAKSQSIASFISNKIHIIRIKSLWYDFSYHICIIFITSFFVIDIFE